MSRLVRLTLLIGLLIVSFNMVNLMQIQNRFVLANNSTGITKEFPTLDQWVKVSSQEWICPTLNLEAVHEGLQLIDSIQFPIVEMTITRGFGRILCAGESR